jgi:hypothetical protein
MGLLGMRHGRGSMQPGGFVLTHVEMVCGLEVMVFCYGVMRCRSDMHGGRRMIGGRLVGAGADRGGIRYCHVISPEMVQGYRSWEAYDSLPKNKLKISDHRIAR